ncbi:MAG: hypothetical protein AAB849_00865 [Patescibacteria group bacterium]
MSDITVNSPDPAAGQNGPLSGSGSFTSILRFHAFADHDQMPIVRLAVDWGDSHF